MKKEKLTTEELLQMNNLLLDQFDGVDAKFQTYLQETMSKQIDKDIKLSELSKNWETLKGNVQIIKLDMRTMANDFKNMNRGARRACHSAYSTAIAECNTFLNSAIETAGKGLSAIASIPQKTVTLAKKAATSAKNAISAEATKINGKIQTFKKDVATKCQSAFATVKFAVIDFSANRMQSLANALNGVYQDIEKKADMVFAQMDKVESINKKDLDAFDALNQQIADTKSLRTDALKHGCIGLALDNQTLLGSLSVTKALSPTCARATRTQDTINRLEKKIIDLAKKEGRVTKIATALQKKANEWKALVKKEDKGETR